ncbi:hypothetical protein LEP1GSC024_0281 [Leptospira noguchii str. 2001034031]|uniref:Uncharacterized protein n=1 Tax=Leptospira noguchii str. 2001034031 TaxID=1193053 RepID=M6YC86_9LEPT|nr:hypothetical protein LEP1GSC024_0281 [Leptospira noguchii str. 2001034031]
MSLVGVIEKVFPSKELACMILTSEFFLNFPQFAVGAKKSFENGTCVEPIRYFRGVASKKRVAEV